MVVVCVQAIKARGSPTRPHRINPANYARFQSTGRLCWPQSRSGFFVEEILIFLSEIEPQWPGSCFRWSGNQIEWGLLTVIKTVLYTWWLSRQLTTVSERLGHNTVSLLPSRVFFVVVVVININLKAWPWWNDFFFRLRFVWIKLASQILTILVILMTSLSVIIWFLNICREPLIPFLLHEIFKRNLGRLKCLACCNLFGGTR